MAGEAETVADWINLLGVTIQNNGSDMPVERKLNFIGATVADNPSNGSTDITISAAGLPTLPSVDGQYALVRKAGVFTWHQIIAAYVQAGFTPTVAMASGGNGPLQCGDVWTPRLTGSPAANAGGVTAWLAKDSNAGSVSRLGTVGAIQPPAATYSSNTVGTVSVWGTVTQSGEGPTDTNHESCPFLDPYFFGCDLSAGATSFAQTSALVATLAGPGTAALPGVLASMGIGTTFTLDPTGLAGGVGDGYLITPHQSTAMTFTSGAAPFGLSRVASSVSITNFFGVTGKLFDVYRTDNPIAVVYLVKRDT
jgi:hypothetical protein